VNRPAKILVAGLILVALAACTAGTPEAQHAAAGGLISQFVLGIWHGIIAPVTLLVEVINKLAPTLLPWKLHMYQGDTGAAYDVGFYLGLAGGPSFLVRRRWSRRV